MDQYAQIERLQTRVQELEALVQRALVQPAAPAGRWGWCVAKLKGPLRKGSSAQADVIDGFFTSSQIDYDVTGQIITVRDVSEAVDLPSGARVPCIQHPSTGEWVALFRCP